MPERGRSKLHPFLSVAGMPPVWFPQYVNVQRKQSFQLGWVAAAAADAGRGRSSAEAFLLAAAPPAAGALNAASNEQPRTRSASSSDSTSRANGKTCSGGQASRMACEQCRKTFLKRGHPRFSRTELRSLCDSALHATRSSNAIHAYDRHTQLPADKSGPIPAALVTCTPGHPQPWPPASLASCVPGFPQPWPAAALVTCIPGDPHLWLPASLSFRSPGHPYP
eukprot:354064-Chlamydomonas_euryale.AAC.3